MSSVLDKVVFGVFFAIALVIIFVRAGQFGGATGGTQTAQIIGALNAGASNFVQTLTGGKG